MADVAGAGGQAGRVLDDRYRIVAELGSGGVGVVYRAEHLQLGRPVAVKLLHSEFGASQNQVLRFEREARTLASLSHPNIVTVTDYGVTDGMPYLVMELLEGCSLQELLRDEGALDPERALDITRQALRALAFAHAQGLVHRDLKPGNIFLQRLPDDPHHVRILDFGLAKFVTGDAAADVAALTRTGAVFGTPAYMAPEQASGDAVDASTDVYALGVVLFEMLAGRRPFVGNMGELLKHHLLSPVPSLHEVHAGRVASPELDRFLRISMGKRREERFSDAGAMLGALDALPSPIVNQRSGPAARSAARPAAAPAATAATVASPRAPSRPARPAPTPPTFPPPAPAGSRTLALLGMTAVLLLSAGVGVAVWGWARTGDPAQALKDAPPLPSVQHLMPKVDPTPAPGHWTRTQGPGGTAAPARAEAPAAPAASTLVNPWSRPVPSELQAIRRQLDAGRAPSQHADRTLRAFARRDPKDPRPHLLLARTYLARGWRSDAIERFEQAYAADPNAKADPHMLTDLLGLVKHAAVTVRASRAIQTIYGRDAIGAIDAKRAKPGIGPDESARLLRLRESLE
jgi:eukaryotic-like serine/threonine-protein kinase